MSVSATACSNLWERAGSEKSGTRWISLSNDGWPSSSPLGLSSTRKLPSGSRAKRQTLASLHHGSIVTVHDAGTTDHDGHSMPYLVMEMLNGVTWETARVDSVVETGTRLDEALAHVHEAEIVNRDVKPANIMISPIRRG